MLGRDALAFGGLVRAAVPMTTAVVSDNKEPSASEPQDQEPPYDHSTWDEDMTTPPGMRMTPFEEPSKMALPWN